MQHPEIIKMPSAPIATANCCRDSQQRFALISVDGGEVTHFLQKNSYSAAEAFVAGKFDVQGDVIAAVRFFMNRKHSTMRSLWCSIAARLARASMTLPGKSRAQRNIQFHYDRSNEFYAQFLDARMQYSAADFSDRGRSLEEAQTQKLERICLALRLRPGERMLDVGCGWGGLVVYAAERFGVEAVGCTLSQSQFDFATALVRRRGLERQVRIELKDYREIEGRFAKIASVGMFEHVGRNRLPEYFEHVRLVLEDHGLFLNRGIVRPEGVSDGPETLFLQRNVFPGGELVHLSEVIRKAEMAGFEVYELEDLRIHYALTCKAWVRRLQSNAKRCRTLVGERAYRTWLLYLAASCVSFEDGVTDDVQILCRKSPRRATVPCNCAD